MKAFSPMYGAIANGRFAYTGNAAGGISGAGATVGLQHVAVHFHGELAEAKIVQHRAHTASHQSLNLLRTATDLLATVTDPLGNVLSNVYDSRDRLLRAIDPLGNSTQFTYDGNGNVLTRTDALGNVTSYTYDGLERLSTVTTPEGVVYKKDARHLVKVRRLQFSFSTS